MPTAIPEKVMMDIEDELLWITVSKYALFMSHGKTGIDSLALFMHYQFTARIQKTNSVWANDVYCRQGLEWGRDRFERAKCLLLDLGIIEIIKTKKENGDFGKAYIKVKTKKVELEPSDISRLPDFTQVRSHASAKTTTNALTKNLNALTKNINCDADPVKENKTKEKKDAILELWLSAKENFPTLIKKHTNTNCIKAKHTSIKLGDIALAITNYCTILSSDLYWYNKPYIKGLPTFLENIDIWIEPEWAQFKKAWQKTEVESDLDRMMSSVTNN